MINSQLPLNRKQSRPHHQSRPQRWWTRRIQYFWKRFLRLRGSENAIARGIAVGVFSGMFPFFGFQSVLGVLLAILIKGNKIAAVTATWISNPFTYFPIFAANFHLGSWLLNTEEISLEGIDFSSTGQLLSLGAIFFRTLLVGCVVTGSIASLSSYLFSLWGLKQVRRKHSHRKR